MANAGVPDPLPERRIIGWPHDACKRRSVSRGRPLCPEAFKLEALYDTQENS